MTGERFPHDAAYKRFFRNRDMVASLLRGFVPEPFIADLDFETLEPYPTAHVTDDFRERFVGNRTALANQIRGLLQEEGIVLPQEK